MYAKILKVKEIMPELFKNLPKKVQNTNENTISYSDLLFLTARYDMLKKVLRTNKKKKDFTATKFGRVYSNFLDAFITFSLGLFE